MSSIKDAQAAAAAVRAAGLARTNANSEGAYLPSYARPGNPQAGKVFGIGRTTYMLEDEQERLMEASETVALKVLGHSAPETITFLEREFKHCLLGFQTRDGARHIVCNTKHGKHRGACELVWLSEQI